MAAERSGADERAFVEHQHRFRGLISDFKSKRYVKERRFAASLQFRSAKAELLLDARAALRPDQFRPFINWIGEQSAVQLVELSQNPVGYDELSGVYSDSPSVSLATELHWIAERLRAEQEKVAAFLEMSGMIERLTLAGEYELAIEALEMMQLAFGVSLWSVQLRVALEHLAGGLECQKRYSAEVRAVFRSGLLGFTTYHTSVRNEDRTTYTKFLDDLNDRIERHAHWSDASKTYMRYRLTDRYPPTDAGLAEILRTEQNHSIIDLYETFVAVLQEIGRRGAGTEIRDAVVNAIEVSAVSDFRLAKLLLLLNVPVTLSLPQRNVAASDALFAGQAMDCLMSARRSLRGKEVPDPWQFIYAGFAFAHARRHRGSIAAKPTELAQLIGRIQVRCNTADDTWSRTAKLCLNLRGLSIGAGLFEFLKQIRRDRPDDPWRPWLIGLNSPVIGIEDIAWSPIASPPAETSISPTAAAWSEADRPTEHPKTPIMKLAAAAGYLHRQDFADAIEVLKDCDVSASAPLRPLKTLLLLHGLFGQSDRQRVVELLAREGSISEAHRRFLPIEATLGQYDWDTFKLVEAPLAAPIALHMLWRSNENSLTASQLRFATGAAFRKAGVEKPSEIIDARIPCSPQELTYFLRDVCVADILDLSRLLRGTRAIMEERQSICSALIIVDPDNRTEYEAEIVLISNQLTMDEGQWIVDKTRIHVDPDAMTRWAVRELAEDYGRYRDLADVSVDTKQTFEDVLGELNESLHSPKAITQPDNEADAVLVSLLRRLGEEFLTNPTFGLDFHLSKRVRHQSFIGLIRGPLEFGGLITTRESEVGEYHRNDALLATFTRSGAVALDEIDAALRHFSTRFDETLTDAKNTYFQLKSAEKPQGMIALKISGRQITIARAIIHHVDDFRAFLAVAMIILWSAINPSLSLLRQLISHDIKSELIKEFDTVRAAVRKVAENDPAFLSFDAAMGNASTEVQRKLDEAANWFLHVDISQQRLFTLDEILKIGVDTALKSHRGYSPKITHSAEGDLSMSSGNLIFVHDVLSVALGNAQRHSGIKEPNIDIMARWVSANSTLDIEVVSDCRSSARAAKEKQAAAIRKAIDSGSHTPRTRTEGGSGFAKIAAIVGQSDKGAIDFGFTDDGRFRLRVRYQVLGPSSEVADAA